MILLDPLARLLGLAGWTRPSFFVAPPALQTARETIAALPEVVQAVLVLPTLSEQLALVQRNTDVLPEILERLDRVEHDTAVLPVMRGDTAAIAAEMPKLVVLEQSLPAVAEGVHHLVDIARPLHGAARRLGRWGDRLPQRDGRGP
jgi:hypothetical protein